MSRCFVLAAFVALTAAGATNAGRYFAEITSVDAEKGSVTYTVTQGKDRGTQFQARIARGCVIKEGYHRLGKPGFTKEGDDVTGGLKNAVFGKASAENPVRVNVYTADEDDEANGVKKGEVVKILVNPPFKKKKE
jgi:hypothetical protein